MKRWDIFFVILLVISILFSAYVVYMGFFLPKKYPDFFKIQDKISTIVIFSLVIIFDLVILISILRKKKKTL